MGGFYKYSRFNVLVQVVESGSNWLFVLVLDKVEMPGFPWYYIEE